MKCTHDMRRAARNPESVLIADAPKPLVEVAGRAPPPETAQVDPPGRDLHAFAAQASDLPLTPGRSFRQCDAATGCDDPVPGQATPGRHRSEHATDESGAPRPAATRVVLSNAMVRVTCTSVGGGIESIELLHYRADKGNVVLTAPDAVPALALRNLPQADADAPYTIDQPSPLPGWAWPGGR